MRDQRAVNKVLTRIDRLALGNFGDYRALDGGVFELRIDEGPGYRLYAARVGKVVVLLLCGGDKKSQAKVTVQVRENTFLHPRPSAPLSVFPDPGGRGVKSPSPSGRRVGMREGICNNRRGLNSYDIFYLSTPAP